MIEKKASEIEEEMRIVNGKPSSLDCLIMNLKGGRRDDVCHYHNYMEMLYGLEGEVNCRVFGKEFTFKQGDLTIINPGEPHGFSAKDGGAKYIVVKFLPQLLYSVDDLSAGIKYILPFTLRRGGKRIYNGSEIGSVGEMMAEIVQEWKEKRYGYELVIRADIEKIFSMILRCEGGIARPEEAISYELFCAIQKAVEYVLNEYQTADARTAAKICNLSYSYFSRNFKKIVKHSFSSYVNSVRLMEAERIMLTSDKSITEIAAEVGFSTTSHFIARFKEYKGISPKQFRMNRVY